MSNLKKSKFYSATEDHIISQLCQDCNLNYDQEEEIEECPNCGSDEISLTTALEDASCAICDAGFSHFATNAYVHSQNNEYICSDCYEELVDEENYFSSDESDTNESILVEMPEVFRTNTFVQQSADTPPTMEMPEVFRTNTLAQQSVDTPPTMEMPAIFKEMLANKNAGESTLSTSVENQQEESNSLRVVSKTELSGKTISRVYFAEWNGATVIETTDNCVCVMYSSYDWRNQHTEYCELGSVEDYKRLILGR